jgi:hypothetical protein
MRKAWCERRCFHDAAISVGLAQEAALAAEHAWLADGSEAAKRALIRTLSFPGVRWPAAAREWERAQCARTVGELRHALHRATGAMLRAMTGRERLSAAEAPGQWQEMAKAAAMDAAGQWQEQRDATAKQPLGGAR